MGYRGNAVGVTRPRRPKYNTGTQRQRNRLEHSDFSEGSDRNGSTAEFLLIIEHLMNKYNIPREQALIVAQKMQKMRSRADRDYLCDKGAHQQ